MMSCVLRNSGLSSIKFLCVTLWHMSICRRVVGTVTFQQVDHAPHGKASAQSHNQNLQNVDSRVEKFHTVFSFSLIKMDWWVQKKAAHDGGVTSGQCGPRSHELVAVQVVKVQKVSFFVRVRFFHLVHRVLVLRL